MEEILRVLPPRLRGEFGRLESEIWSGLEEIRLRPGRPAILWTGTGRQTLGPEVTGEELEQLLQLSARGSMHTVLSQLRRGYLTLRGGHRLGVCGSVSLREGEIHAIAPISALNLRLARQVRGAGEDLLLRLCPEGRFSSTLILSPPGRGKTTLLRDLVRALSDRGTRVGLADERGEVAALYQGVPQLEVGENTDVMEGCPKAQALMLLLRGMNPQLLAADEITDPADVWAMSTAVGCGVELLCTAHGQDRRDLTRRPMYREMAGLFRFLVTIGVERGQRSCTVEELL